jgi:hypothetical protein
MEEEHSDSCLQVNSNVAVWSFPRDRVNSVRPAFAPGKNFVDTHPQSHVYVMKTWPKALVLPGGWSLVVYATPIRSHPSKLP